MLFKTVLVLLLLFVIVSLFTGFYFLMRDPSSSQRIVKALFLRVSLSLFIMLLLGIGLYFGWVLPQGLAQ
ncbi:MAG: twin transmembrane helix small protein [Gammaproteobacteria bacterium]|nr:twin transmembrane helix small protein [Gammaproteobacteria bacterium]MCY4227628.1 twin transmembrane helix small protein [Gammaproteobacteria bacterium]MCY4314198.1 twin transmembrane helix small protein [Gammaproteobacteria bacterium]